MITTTTGRNALGHGLHLIGHTRARHLFWKPMQECQERVICETLARRGKYPGTASKDPRLKHGVAERRAAAKESVNGAHQTQVAERGRSALQPFYSWRNQSSIIPGRRAAPGGRRFGSDRDCRSIDAQLRLWAAGIEVR